MFGLYGAWLRPVGKVWAGRHVRGGRICGSCSCRRFQHFASAEKQFRFPLEYGNQRPYSATWTVTGCGAVIVSSGDCRGKGSALAKITAVTTGKIVDMDFHDSMNMGGCDGDGCA